MINQSKGTTLTKLWSTYAARLMRDFGVSLSKGQPFLTQCQGK